MTPRTRRRFDATWLPFGMMIGFTVGVGLGLAVFDNLFAGALVGFIVGAGLGIALGFRDPRRSGTRAEEDAEDDLYRRQHGDPGPRGDGPSSGPPERR
ncbi:MAG: AtpZ/AtpI family protein [Actinomycetales bacterium]|nr:AtpZ/AtpI family protein [Actinomycetales bacterium]